MALAEGKLGKYTWAAFLLLVSIALFFIYPADVILTGNQYIYFFWGMKNAGIGYLANDFLAQEADPFPLFSLIVTFTETYLGRWFYYVLYWLVGLVYVASLFNIARYVFGERKISTFWLPVATLFLALHATPIWSFFMRHAFEVDLRWLWDNGVATQGLLMGYFQSSSMGVLLLWSVERFVKGKLVFACVLAAIAGAFHANYLLLGGVMVGVYLFLSVKEKKWLQIGLSFTLALTLTLPYAWYVYQNFTTVGMSVEELSAFKSALEVVRQDNPHLDPKAWLNAEAGFKMLLIGFAAWVLRKTKLGMSYMALLNAFILLSAAALLSGNVFLINLAPWRLSVVLVPVATCVLVFKAVEWLSGVGYRWVVVMCAMLLLPACMVFAYRFFGGFFRFDKMVFAYLLPLVVFVATLWVFRQKGGVKVVALCLESIVIYAFFGCFMFVLDSLEKKGYALIHDVYKEREEGSLYLIPPADTYFRLEVGVSVYVDNNLYFSRNLADWKERKDFAEWFYSLSEEDGMKQMELLKERGITHVVYERRRKLTMEARRAKIYKVE